jgi:hypothetical protein
VILSEYKSIVESTKRSYGEQDAQEGFRRARKTSINKVVWPASGALLRMPLASQLEGMNVRPVLVKYWPEDWRKHQEWSQPNILQEGEFYLLAIRTGYVPRSLSAGTKPAAIAGGKIRWNLSGGRRGEEVMVQWVRNCFIPSPEDQKLLKLTMFDIFFHASISDPEVYHIAYTDDPDTEEYEIHSQAGAGEEGDDPRLHISGDEVMQTPNPPLVAQPVAGMHVSRTGV